MSIERRLKRLEGRITEPNKGWVVPIEVRVLTKAVARHQAHEAGRELPPYTQEEVEEMRQSDIEILAGGGAVGKLRDSKGWQSEEANELLDAWERDAHRRLEAVKDLPPERWGEVYEHDDEEETDD